MKLKLTICAFMMVFLTGSVTGVNAGSVNVEMLGALSLVQKVDEKKRIIYMHGKEVSYNSLTKFYDADGQKAGVSDLRPGYAISFDIDKSKRFFLRPTASVVRIKSKIPLLNKR